MTPSVELYLHVPKPWLGESALSCMEQRLNALTEELLAQPRGPEHVLSELQTIEISIVDDATIARVHGEFLGDPTPTDVITFPHGDGMGEILVSADTAENYAAEHGLRREEELFRYMAHGLVHLHGYLDATPEQRAELFSVQEPLVARFLPPHPVRCPRGQEDPSCKSDASRR